MTPRWKSVGFQLLRTLGPLTTGFLGLSVLASALLSPFSLSGSSLLLLSPAALLWTPWTLLCHPLVSKSLLSLALNLPSVVWMSKYFEAVWGPRGWLHFYAFVSVLSALGMALQLLLDHLLSPFHETWLYVPPFGTLILFSI